MPERSEFSLSRSKDAATLAQLAWVGDAVLLLFARTFILNTMGHLDDDLCVHMTSNQFLSAFGEPTKVEAEIGRVYQQSGLEAANDWITQNLLPVFERQEENRRKRASGGRTKTRDLRDRA